MIRPRCASVNPIEFVRMLPDLRWPKPNFKTAALNHSATFHGRNFNHLTDLLLLPKPKVGAGLAPARPFSFLFHSEATNSPQRSFPGVGYLVQDVLHAWGLR